MRQYFLRDRNETQIRMRDMKICIRERESFTVGNSRSRIFVCQCIVYVYVSTCIYNSRFVCILVLKVEKVDVREREEKQCSGQQS